MVNLCAMIVKATKRDFIDTRRSNKCSCRSLKSVNETENVYYPIDVKFSLTAIVLRGRKEN